MELGPGRGLANLHGLAVFSAALWIPQVVISNPVLTEFSVIHKSVSYDLFVHTIDTRTDKIDGIARCTKVGLGPSVGDGWFTHELGI